MQIKLEKIAKTKTNVRWNVANLKETGQRFAHQKKLCQKLTDMNIDEIDEIDQIWSNLK